MSNANERDRGGSLNGNVRQEIDKEVNDDMNLVQ